MGKFIVVLIITLFGTNNLHVQDLMGEEFKQLFHAIQTSDEKKFSEKLGMQTEGETIEGGRFQFNADQDSIVASKILIQLIEQADSMGINLKEADYVDCYYSISKQPGSLLVSLTGKIAFK